MTTRRLLLGLATFLTAAQFCYGATEATVYADGFDKIVSQMEGGEAREFFAALGAPGTEFTCPLITDLAALTAGDRWIDVDGDKVTVPEEYMTAFCRVFAEGRVSMTPRTEKGTKRVVGQQEEKPRHVAPQSEAGTAKGGSGKKGGKAEAPSAPAYRLSYVYGGPTYGDAVFSAEDRGKVYSDYEVAGVVDALSFKSFPYNSDGDAQKLFREKQKKMEGIMASSSGRENVLRTYAYYDMKGDSWKTDLLEDILAHYKLGKITKE